MNSFGQRFRITTFGESHGPAVGVVIDGCPAGLLVDLDAVQHELDRRRPGQSRISTQRQEGDRLEVLSGLLDGMTTGAPIACIVRNEDQRSQDYTHLVQTFRPSHADFTYSTKYGLRDHRGGGRSSARETLARVIGGAIAKQLLRKVAGVAVEAWVCAVGSLDYAEMPAVPLVLAGDDCEMVRCPDPVLASAMVAAIDAARLDGDSLGGIIACRALNVPAGWGEPVYGKLSAMLGAAMLGINAVKGFELGSGFAGTRMRGSAHNDTLYMQEGRTRTRSNHSGGVQGGISNGEDVFFRVAFKPTSTIMRDQPSVDAEGNEVVLKGKGRHDPCVVPRAVPIVEAMAALVLADAYLLSLGSRV